MLNCKLHPAVATAVPPVIPNYRVYNLKGIFFAMIDKRPTKLEGHEGIINGIQKEDGSGKRWLVKFHNRAEWLYVRAE